MSATQMFEVTNYSRSAHPGESRDPGQASRLVPPSGCSLRPTQAAQRFLDPGFRRDERNNE